MVTLSWFFLALVGPFLYALTNQIDKHLLDKHFLEDGVATLLIFSALASALALPFIAWMEPAFLDVSLENMAVLALVAILNVILLWAYLEAMSDEEPTVVIIFYQLVPVLGIVFGNILLGETISEQQGWAMTVIIFGTSIIGFEVDGAGWKFKWKTAAYMLTACACWALESPLFKLAAINEEDNVWRSLFWEHVMLVLVGIGILIFSAKHRYRFVEIFRTKSKTILSLNITNEALFMSGNVVMAFTAMMVPVALNLLMNSFQPIFVMITGFILAICLPKLATEKLDPSRTLQRIIAIAVTGLGTYLLLSS